MAQPVKEKSNFKKNFKSEFNQIVWPNKSQVISKTMVVIFVSILFTLLIAGFDGIYRETLNRFFNIG